MRKRYVVLAFAVLLAMWAPAELWGPAVGDIRAFNAAEVARMETGMWRAYYEQDRVRLFTGLTEILRSQYHMRFSRSHVTAYHAAKAAFLFKRGRNRDEYRQALPDLQAFYSDVAYASRTPFNPMRAAELELEWWIVHRERDRYSEHQLRDLLAELQAEIYGGQGTAFAEHARLRAEAMLLRDRKATASNMTDAEWDSIREMLHRSWASLNVVVQAQTSPLRSPQT